MSSKYWRSTTNHVEVKQENEEPKELLVLKLQLLFANRDSYSRRESVETKRGCPFRTASFIEIINVRIKCNTKLIAKVLIFRKYFVIIVDLI